MNVIKKILFALTIVFSLAGCDLTPSESIKYMREAEQHPAQQQTQSFAPYLAPEDILVVKMLGSFIDLNIPKAILNALFALELVDYNGPTIPLVKYIGWVYNFAIAIFGVLAAVMALKAFLKGTQEEHLQRSFTEEFQGVIKPCMYFLFGSMLGGMFAFLLIPASAAISNALFANAVNAVYNNNKAPISSLAVRLNKRNDIAEAVFARKLEEKRTSMAKAVRFSMHLSSSNSSLDGNNRQTTFSEFAEYQSKLVGIEYATNINRTVNWVDFVVSWGLFHSLYKFFSAEQYPTAISLYGKSNGGFFIDDTLNFETSNFTIGLGKDVIEDNDDFSSNDSNSLKRRNTIAKGMNYKSKMDALTALNSIQTTVKASLAADDYSYVSNTYDSVFNAVKADFVAAANSVEQDIQEFETDAQRTEMVSSVMGLVAAAKIGIDKDETFIKIYNWLDAAGVDWLSVNCVDTTLNYNNQKKALAYLNASSRPLSSELVQFGTLDRACILPVGNQYQLLTMDAVNNVDAIKAKFVNAKSHAQALKIYYNIVTLAGKDAYKEVVNKYTNSNSQALKKQLKGIAAAPLQLVEIVKAKHSKDVIANRIDNAVTYNYVGGTKEYNNFVDDAAVFGTPESKNYVQQTEQDQVRSIFREIKFLALFDDNSLATGNIASLNQIEKNIENSFAQGVLDAFTDTVLGPVDDAMKYAGGLPLNMNITDGLAYCERTGCPETFKPSLFETVVISGKKFRDAGVVCIATISAVRAANEILDVSDSANAAGSSGAVASAGGAVKFGAKAIKAISAGAAATAEMASTPCYLMLAAGITNGEIMPMSYAISLVFMCFTVLVLTFAIILIWPFTCIIDLWVDGIKMEYSNKVLRHGAGLLVIMFIVTAGTLFTFAAMLWQPYDIVRILLDLGFGAEAGLIAQLIAGLSLALVLPLLFKLATNVSDEVVKTLLQIMNLGVNIDGAKEMNNQLAQTAIGGMTASKITQASRIAEMPVKDFAQYKKEQQEIMKQIKARETADAIQNARSQAASRNNGQFEDEGKKLDDDVMKDPDFKKDNSTKDNKDKGDKKDKDE